MQQAINQTNADPLLCRHMESLGHNEWHKFLISVSVQIFGLVQDCGILIATTLKMLQSCSKSSIFLHLFLFSVFSLTEEECFLAHGSEAGEAVLVECAIPCR